MNKDQTIKSILIFFTVLWSVFALKYYLFPHNLSNKEIGRSVVQSVIPKIGEIGIIHNQKLSNKEVKERLGRSTWTLLHTMAAVYPAFPTVQHKRDTLQFIYLLSSLFPCAECAGHFQKLLSQNPPQVATHDDFVQWLCKAHNIVNKRLEKPIMDCSKVEGVWSCGCKAE